MGTLEYKFVKIEVKIHAFKGVVPVEDNHQIVDQHAQDAWRLVQIFVSPIKGYGIADFF